MASKPILARDQKLHDHSHDILGVAIGTGAAALICVVVRVYIRAFVLHSFGLNDYLIIISGGLVIAGVIFNGFSTHYGAGNPASALPDPTFDRPKVMLWNTAYQFDYVIGITMTKLSIMAFVLKISTRKWMFYSCYTVAFFTVATNIVFVAALAAQCQPLRKLWDPSVPGTCMYKGELAKFGYAQGVVNVLTDLFCTLTPIFIVWKVRITLYHKILLGILMSFGLVATAFSIVRVVVLDSLSDPDYTYGTTTIILAALLDQNLGVIGACLPAMQPVIKKTRQSVVEIRRTIRVRTSRVPKDLDEEGIKIPSIHHSRGSGESSAAGSANQYTTHSETIPSSSVGVGRF